jgi:hypothetical protein
MVDAMVVQIKFIPLGFSHIHQSFQQDTKEHIQVELLFHKILGLLHQVLVLHLDLLDLEFMEMAVVAIALDVVKFADQLDV